MLDDSISDINLLLPFAVTLKTSEAKDKEKALAF